MKVGMLQLNFKVGDFDGNMAKLLQAYDEVVQKGAQLVIASELALFGYPPGDMLFSQRCVDAQHACLERLSEHIGEVGLIVGAAMDTQRDTGLPLYNSAVLIRNGEKVHVQHKTLLPNYDVFDEKRYFEPGGQTPGVISYNGLNLGVLICEDIWSDVETVSGNKLYDTDPVDAYADQPMDALVTINASPFYVGKTAIRMDLARSISRRLGCPLIYANQVGGNDELVFDGQSFAVAPDGELIALAGAFTEENLVFDLHDSDRIDTEPPDDIRNLHDALVIGTHDYVMKAVGAPKVLVALSGGIDSAVTAAIASRAVGPENVMGFGMPSAFSSEGSIEDARALAKNLGIRFELIPIGKTYDQFGKMLDPVIGWGTPGENDGDVTEENVQARIRGSIMMAISNRNGGIVLSTGNKSEISVGYCTLYGDMVGGFAVLSDVFKTQVYELARYVNRTSEIIPWRTIHKPPSAELSPGQTDQDALPPYEQLDVILDAYIEEGLGTEEIVATGMDKAMVEWVIGKVKANEYKRRQMAPGLKISQKAFGSGRRYPIAAAL